ncbi:hypothetical protein SAMN05660420_01098 [Desulfuromusa kysingii]|uniref:Uncharacterized protein n=1 Tax=Desulfuromusa kysingii TaxID=37625 RepID=A0A1H3Y4Y3_9BACT|nr:hypothetical protein [Desulfuromusa kysingii]SEA06787.1 hypothetical protein SAMN05660420_01098 [Desulfuromusa kysingii]
MIWLSPASGTKECSIYFDIRDIDLQRSEGKSTGVIRGLVGDGSCELWGEVFLGQREYAQVLPLWTESGEVESFSDEVDESLLLQEMLTAVKGLQFSVGSSRHDLSLCEHANIEFSTPSPTDCLAA